MKFFFPACCLSLLCFQSSDCLVMSPLSLLFLPLCSPTRSNITVICVVILLCCLLHKLNIELEYGVISSGQLGNNRHFPII